MNTGVKLDIHIGFTGTREGMSDNQKIELTKKLKEYISNNRNVIFHHGDCIGADKEAFEIAKSLDCYTISHPPVNEKYRAFCKSNIILEAKDYLDRNKDIVNESIELIAAPLEDEEQLRSGTWSTIRYAKNKLTNVIILKR